MSKPKYNLEELTTFSTYDDVGDHKNFVPNVVDSALDLIRGYEHEVARLQSRVRELEKKLRVLGTEKEEIEMAIEIKDIKDIYVVWQNSDLTEGKGYQKPLAACLSKETALRLGTGKDVQGTNCVVTKHTAFQVNNFWYAPTYLIPESQQDKLAREYKEKREAILEKARSVLSEEEILELTKRP